MNGISNIFDASEVWTDDDLNLFLNLQTPIHKKKDDLLFAHDELEGTGLSDLSISPLIPIRGVAKLSCPSSTLNPPSVSNSSNMSLKPVSTKEVTNSTTNCKINKNETNVCQPPMNTTRPQEIISKPSSQTSATKQNDENIKPNKSINNKPVPPPTTQNETKAIKQLRVNEPQATKKPTSPKKTKHPKQKNITTSTTQPPPKINKPKKQILPSPIPLLTKNQSVPNLPPKPSISITPPQIQPIPIIKQEETKQDPNQPPPLPNLPPQQLILKLFEEKQKRFFNRFEDDSLLLIDFISNYSVL